MLHALSSTPLSSLSALVLDTETTGLDVKTARIIQIGYVRINKGTLDERSAFECLVKPDVAIPPETSLVHGLYDADVESAPNFSETIAQTTLLEPGTVIIGHNISYDLKILAEEHRRHGLSWRHPRALCTAQLARAAFPSLNIYSLDGLCERFDITIDQRHSALGDAIGTAKVFLNLIPVLAERGIRTLAEAESICERFTDDEAAMIGGRQSGWRPADARQLAAPVSRVDAFPFSHRVKEIMSGPPRIVAPTMAVKDIASILSTEGISSVLVSPVDEGDSYGIITERDVMRLVAADEPVGSLIGSDIMSAPLISIGDEQFVYKALAAMSHAQVRHLGVHNSEGEIVGVLTTGNLVRQRADDALILGDNIDQAQSAVDLGGLWSRVPFVAKSMLGEAIGVRDIAAIIAEEMCALTKRAFDLAEERLIDEGHGAAPCPFAVLVLGSGGRGETLLSPDQDNAVIYDADSSSSDVDAWFEKLGTYAADILNEAGLPYCNGGVMAKNRIWRHNFAGWQEVINSWAGRAEGKDLLHVDIFYDFRAVSGDEALAYRLREFALSAAKMSPPLLRKMGSLTADLDSALGLFGGILTKSGRADLKKNGLLAIVSGARVLALHCGIDSVSTLDRLSRFKGFRLANDSDIENVISAHEIILQEILRQQLEDIDKGISPSSNVEIKRLSARRKSDLKWALAQVEIIKQLSKDVVM